MAKEKKILAVDVGGSSLKMAEFIFPAAGGIQLTGFRFRRVDKLDGESDGACFERNYLEMLGEGGFTATEVRLLLSAGNSFQRLSKLPPMLGSSATVSRLIEFEASQAVPYSMDEVEWGYQLLHHRWEETRAVEQEDGTVENISVANEEYEALFVAMKSEDVVCYTDVIENAGQKLLSVELAPLALFNAAVVSQIREDECVLVLDIGSRTSSLMIADRRRIFMRNIPLGGDTVTAQIAREFGVPESEAEDLKRRVGFVALGGAYDEPDSELAATISKLARNAMTRLHGEISRSVSVWRAQHGGDAPTRVLLAGGGSTMQYTTDFFQEKLRLPVEYLNTFGLIGINPSVDLAALQNVASMSQSLIGAALRNIGTLPVDISLLPRSIRKQVELNARKPYFYASAAALVCCLIVSAVGVSKELDFEKKRVARVEEDVRRADGEVKKINAVAGELNSWRGQYDESAQFLRDRGKFTDVLNAIQEMMPDRMWLVSLEPAVQSGENNGGDEAEPGRRDEKREKHQTPESVNALREVRNIALTGYTLNLDENRNLFDEFISRVRKSGLFEPNLQVPRLEIARNSNLTYFEVILTLKEALKK